MCGYAEVVIHIVDNSSGGTDGDDLLDKFSVLRMLRLARCSAIPEALGVLKGTGLYCSLRSPLEQS